MCGTASPGEDLSLLGVYNNSSFGSALLARELAGFQKLYRKKAMLHHYTEFVEEQVVADAGVACGELIEEYAALGASGNLKQGKSECLRHAQLFPAF